MLDEPQQHAVIRGLRDGDRDAWTALYDAYSVDIWRYVARLVGERATEVADVVQETFIAAAKGARHFDSQRGSLWNWLAGIAHHQTALHWRKINKGMRLKELVESGAGGLHRWLDTSTGKDEVAEQREVVDLVRFVLANISADYAQLLVAKYLDEQSLEEMAAELGGSVEAMKSKLARARREFRRKLEQLTLDPEEIVCE